MKTGFMVAQKESLGSDASHVEGPILFFKRLDFKSECRKVEQ